MLHLRATAALIWAGVCLLVVAALLCAPWAVMAVTPNPPRWMDAVTLGKVLLLPAGVGLLWAGFRVVEAALPSRDARDIDLARDEQPGLHTFVHSIASAVGVTAPARLTLTAGGEVELRWRAGPELALGLSALHLLDEQQLRAVVAHELAYLRPGRASPRLLAWRLHRACLKQRLVHGQLAAWVLLPYMTVASWLANPSHHAMEIDADRCAAQLTSPAIAAQAWRNLMAAQVVWADVVPSLVSMFDFAGARANLGDAVRHVVGVQSAHSKPFICLVGDRIAIHGTNPWDPRVPLGQRLSAWDSGQLAARGGFATESSSAPTPMLSVAREPASSLLVGDLGVAEALHLDLAWPMSTWDEVVAHGGSGALASQGHFHVVTLLNDRVMRTGTLADLLRVLTSNQSGRLVDEWFDMGVGITQGEAAPLALAFDDDDAVTLTNALGVAHTIVAAAVAHAGVGGVASWKGQAFIDVLGPDGTSTFELVEAAVADASHGEKLAQTLEVWGVDLQAPLLPAFERAALATAPRMEGVVTGMTSSALGHVDVYVWSHAAVAVPSGAHRESLVRSFVEWNRAHRLARNIPFGVSTPPLPANPVRWEAMMAHPQSVTLLYTQVKRAKLGWLRQRYQLEMDDATIIDLESTPDSHDFGEPSLALSAALAGRLR